MDYYGTKQYIETWARLHRVELLWGETSMETRVGSFVFAQSDDELRHGDEVAELIERIDTMSLHDRALLLAFEDDL
jgi:hypothetical protein